ncbi:RING finger protein 37-like [Amphiura filiformis]|uniref:RING finger protein 37-like n=1 Tax=Amphiura filiformis TaxID=82378 RepID=UPI003B219F56
MFELPEIGHNKSKEVNEVIIMSVNFCRPELQPKISTSTVCSDGYGVNNLLTYNPFRGGWKGFMAESFIKPPVDITIEFPINICIEKIVLDPMVGSQKSSGFEVYSATIPAKQQCSDDAKKKPAQIFTRIANAFVPWASIGQNPCVVRFINTSYRSSFPDISRLSPQQQDVKGSGDVERFLRLASPGAVHNLNHLTIRITHTYGGSILVLRRLEVWGEPSMRIPRHSQLWALEIIQSLFVKKDVSRTDNGGSSSNSIKSNQNSEKLLASSNHIADKDVNECPEDFLDPITYQMMMLPVLLPSGHTVDRSTLDKHNKTEAIWGRPPNDPFTGVSFTSKSQPIPNVKLKTRIDQYLLTCSDKHKLVARDVGRASDGSTPSGPSASTLVMPNTTQMRTPTPIKETGVKLKSRHNLPMVSASTSSKSKRTMNTTHSTSRSSELVKTSLPNRQKRMSDAGGAVSLTKKTKLSDAGSLQRMMSSSDKTSKTGITKSHEDSVTDSLDSALYQALGSLPSYSSTPSQSPSLATNGLNHTSSTSSTPPPSCAACHVEMKSTALNVETRPAVSLYRLPCSHLICRDCLVTPTDKSAALNQQDTRFCASCSRSYRKEDVVRVHL